MNFILSNLKKRWLTAIFFVCIFVFCFLLFQFLIRHVYSVKAMNNALVFERALNDEINVGRVAIFSMFGAVTAVKNLSNDKVDKVGAALDLNGSGVITIGIAPHGVVRFVYPESERNKKILLHDISADNARKMEYKKAISNDGITISGVLKLKQSGDDGFILRKPYYKNNKFEGVVFVAFDANVITLLAKKMNVSIMIYNDDVGWNVINGRSWNVICNVIHIGNMQIHVLTETLSGLKIFSLCFFLSALLSVILLCAFTSLVVYVNKTKLEMYCDVLTGAMNRRYLYKKINRIERFNVIMADIDFFKRINDGYGHDAGDSVLRQFVELIGKSIRETDIIVRYGGEEFLIVINGDFGFNTAINTAERLRRAVEENEFIVGEHKLDVTCSLGVACGEDHGFDLDKVISAADKNLYLAKTHGRNMVKF